MKRVLLTAALTLASTSAWGHFMVLKPSTDIVEGHTATKIKLQARFTHPVEGGPNMPFKIVKSGAFIRGRVIPIRWERHEISAMPGSEKKVPYYTAQFKLRFPGVYQFFLVPDYYFEPAEGKFIRQITKVEVEAFGMEEGWDKPVGLKAEIVPITRPFGLWEGNTFVGRVYFNGKPAPNTRVEVEFINDKGIKVPAEPFITQVIKTDKNGYFYYSIPFAGWWGFSAIGEGGKRKYKDGKVYPVELDAVMWVKAYPRPEGVR
ncbi:DUF4198 domain-containing protein [Thermovibrio sp.]